jgi:FkbM family methyltransferase
VSGVRVSAGLKAVVRRLLPRRTVPHRIRGGLLRGMTIITSWHDYPAAILGTTEAPLVGWFYENVRSGQTWLDIGAHYGYTALALSRLVGASGRVFAFEPVLATAACLALTRQRNSLNNLTVLPLALGADSGLRVLRLATVRGMADTVLDATAPALEPRESLLETSLDWLWPQICGPRQALDGVKIDVQGMELHLLRGMVGVLRTNRPKIVLEFHAGVDRRLVLEVLQSAGYTTRAAWSTAAADDGTLRDNESYLFLPSV